MENIYTQQKSANVSAASQRVAAPSAGGLALGLAGSALSGVQAGLALKAPAAGDINQLGPIAKANNVQVRSGYYGPAY